MNVPLRVPIVFLFAALAAVFSMQRVCAGFLPAMAFELPTTLPWGIKNTAVVDSEGNCVVVAATELHKYSRSGYEMFSRTLTMTPAALAVGTGGEIYLAGKSGPDASTDLTVAKYGADGQLAWQRTAGGAGMDEAYDIAVDELGGIYAAGYTTVDQADFFVVKYDAAGAEQWTRRFSGSAGSGDWALSLAAAPGGGVTACGVARNPAVSVLTICYDATGKARWTSFYDLPDGNAPALTPIVRTSDGGFAVAGRFNAAVRVVKYSAAGDQAWDNPVPGAASIGNAAPGPDGDVAVITMAAMRYDSLGFPMIGTVSVSNVSAAGAGWSLILGDSETLGGTRLVAAPGGYFASSGYSTRYHNWPASLAGMTFGGTDFASTPLPTYLSNMLGGPVGTYMLAAGADGSLWMIYNSPMNSTLLLRRYGVPVPPPVPEVATGGVENVKTNSAVLKGHIDPKGAGVTWRFEYALSFTPTNFYTTPWQQLNGPAADVSAAVGELYPAFTYQYRLAVTSGAGTFYGEQRTLKTLSPYQTWAAAAFGSAEGPGSGPLDDPDGDGTVNLVEYALGSQGSVFDPGQGIPVFELWTSPESGLVFPSLVYRLNAQHYDVDIIPLASTDLQNWSDTGITLRSEANGTTRAVAGAQQRFMRLKVNLR